MQIIAIYYILQGQKMNVTILDLLNTLKKNRKDIIDKGESTLIKTQNSTVLNMLESSMLNTIVVKNDEFSMEHGLFECGEKFTVDTHVVPINDDISALMCVDEHATQAVIFVNNECNRIKAVTEFDSHEDNAIFSAISD